MIINTFFQEMIGLLPLLILCLTVLCVLFVILLHRDHCVTFFVTILGISISFISLYLLRNNEIFKITSLFYIDKFSLVCMILVLIASLVCSVVSYMWLSCNCCVYRDEFYLLLLIITIGAIVVINASHLVMLFFGIELVSLPVFGLISYVTGRKYAIKNTIKYVLLSGISTSFFLFGMALVYAETGCLSFSNIAIELVTKNIILSQSMIFMAGVSMMLVGFGFKLSLVPFHLWTADVYQGSSEISGMCLATINKIAVFSGLVRFFLLFPASYNKITYILMIMSCLSILFGNLMAIQEDNVKRILAYSSITYMGYLLIGVIGNIKSSFYIFYHDISNIFTDGIETISICLVNYVFATLGAFSVLSLISCIYYRDKKIEDIGVLSLYRGLFWKDPVLSILFTIIILSLVGIPATLGFICKFYLIMFSMERELWWCTIFIIFGSGVSVLYYLRVVITLYLHPVSKNIKIIKVSGIRNIINLYCNNQFSTTSFSILAVYMCSLLLLFFGMFPQCLLYLFSLMRYT